MNENAISEPELILPSLKANRNERRGGWNIIILCKYYLIIELSWNSHLHGYLIYENVIKILHYYASSIIFIYMRLYYMRLLRNGYLLYASAIIFIYIQCHL